MLKIALLIISSYLIGSIPTGFLIVKFKKNIDIRTVGSGSTGATNVKRVLGKNWFFIVMILDALKGFVPVFVASKLFGHLHFGSVAVLCAIGVILGHSKPVFLQFKGGKSVASGVGTIFALSPLTGLAVTIIWATIAWFSKYISLASIIALWSSAIVIYLLKTPVAYVIYCLLGAIYITYLHRENIKRLINGNENKVR